MLLCKVHNIVTDQRYEFQAADQAEIDAKLLRKAATYGRDAWTETMLEYWERDIDGVPGNDVFHPAQVIEHSAQRTVEVTNIDAEIAAARAERDAERAARDYFSTLDWAKIEDAETRKALRHLWRLVKKIA